MNQTYSIAVGPIFVVLLLSLLIPGTILGWVAAARIRHSGGKLYGLRLAAVAAMLVPSLLLALIPVASSIILLRIAAFKPKPELIAGSSELLSIGFFLTLSLISIRIFHGLLRKVLGKGRGRDAFRLKTNRLPLIALGVCWILLGTLIYLQRPRHVDKMVSADSSDKLFAATGTTWSQMRIFGSDKLYYKFNLQGRGGTINQTWRVAVPTSKLAKDYLSSPSSNYYFSKHGAIEWSTDNAVVRFIVDGIEVFATTVEGRVDPPKPTVSGSPSNSSSTATISSPPNFEPTVSRVLHTPQTGSPAVFIDFDTGKITTATDEIDSITQSRRSTDSLPYDLGKKLELWTMENGSDLVVLEAKPQTKCALYGMTSLPMPEGLEPIPHNETLFDHVTAENVISAVESLHDESKPLNLRTSFEKFTTAGYRNTGTGLFETREGRIGVYETSNPKNSHTEIRIRYKLLATH